MKQEKCIFKVHQGFLKHLTTLVDIKTCFWMDEGITKGISVCQAQLTGLAATWHHFVDHSGNLLILGNNYDLTKPMLYYIAHMDTVGAEAGEWDTPPFKATVTEDYIIGRGANDCKAGVAMILTLIDYLGKDLDQYNIAFGIMFREEGNRKKTSSAIEFKTLPTSEAGTYVVTLENTLSLEPAGQFELAAYNREPHNLFITVRGKLKRLKNQLPQLMEQNWKPVVIKPVGYDQRPRPLHKIVNVEKSGHIATVPKDNTLAKTILTDFPAPTAILCGKKEQASVMAATISLFDEDSDFVHELILNQRCMQSIAEIKSGLQDISYEETFGFDYGLGSDQSQRFNNSNIGERLKAIAASGLTVRITDNPGRSDASAIYNANPDLDYLIPFAMGPGCRSHVDGEGTHRLTHGKNEGFYIPSALVTIPAFINFSKQFKKDRL